MHSGVDIGARTASVLPACSRGPRLESFVVTSVLQLLCRTTKLCWYDDDAFRNIVADAKRFLEKVSFRQVALQRLQCDYHA